MTLRKREEAALRELQACFLETYRNPVELRMRLEEAAVGGWEQFRTADGLGPMLQSVLDTLIATGRWAELSALVRAALPRWRVERAVRAVEILRGPLGRNEADLLRLQAYLNRGNFHGARAMILARIGTEPPRSERTLSEFRMVAEALRALIDPWALIHPVLRPPFSNRADGRGGETSGTGSPDPRVLVWRALGRLESARVLFGARWDCNDAEREADLLCHRLRFAMTRNTGRPRLACSPYQSIVRYRRRGNHATAGRIALLWVAGLVWELLDDGWLEEDVRARFRPAVSPLKPAARLSEARLATALLGSWQGPEETVAEVTEEFRGALEAVLELSDAPPSSGATGGVSLPALEMLSRGDLDLLLVAGVLFPDRLDQLPTGAPR